MSGGLSKIYISEQYLEKCLTYKKNANREVFSLSDKSFISTNGSVIIEVPTSQISNINDLQFSKNDSLTKVFNSQADKFKSFADLPNVKISELSDLVIKQELGVEFNKTPRKFNRYNCSLSYWGCTIKQGLALGYDYDHCGSCLENRGESFLIAKVDESVTIGKKELIVNKSINESDPKKVNYYSPISPENLELVKELLNDMTLDIKFSRILPKQNFDFGFLKSKDAESRLTNHINDYFNNKWNSTQRTVNFVSQYSNDNNGCIHVITVPVKKNSI